MLRLIHKVIQPGVNNDLGFNLYVVPTTCHAVIISR